MITLGIIGSAELMIILIGILSFGLLPLLALIDILRSEFTGNNKLIWLLVVLLSNFIGSILYFIIGRNNKINRY
jgi:hypothetical protein